jgi:hypothetical protein
MIANSEVIGAIQRQNEDGLVSWFAGSFMMLAASSCYSVVLSSVRLAL